MRPYRRDSRREQGKLGSLTDSTPRRRWRGDTHVVIQHPGYDHVEELEPAQMQSRIWLAGVSGLTLDDIQINMIA